jgi:hypothetical protein
VALVFAVIALGPGASSLSYGQTNFVLACALAAAGGLVAVTLPRVAMPLHVAAVGGALVGVAHNWAPLLVLAVPAAAAMTIPIRRRRWSGTRPQWAATAAVLAVTVFGIVVAFEILASLDPTTVVMLNGGIDAAPLGVSVAVTLAASVTCLAAFRLRHVRLRDGGLRRSGGSDTALRLTWLAVAPILGLALAAVIAVIELADGAPLRYYFWKFAMGLETVSVVIFVAAVTALVVRTIPKERGRSGRVVATTSALALGLAATQIFGYVGPYSWTNRPDFTAAGARLAAQSAQSLTEPNGAAEDLIAGTAVQFAHPDRQVVFLSLPPTDLRPDLGELWYRALTRTWSIGSFGIRLGTRSINSMAAAAAVATSILLTNPNALVLVRPDRLEPLRDLVLDPSLQSRIVTW